MEQFERKRGRRLLLRIVLALLCGMVWWLANRHAHGAVPPVRSIIVHARRVEVVPGELMLRRSEPVKLVLNSADVPHALAMVGLQFHAELAKGHPVSVSLTPAADRDFVGIYSKFCGSRHRDMHLAIHAAP